jgi:Ca2+-binding RTX toxin-like protein
MDLRAKQSNQQSNQLGVQAIGLLLLLIALTIGIGMQAQAMAQQGVEFAGTVLSVDVGAKKFAVLKEGGGTRFTFVANDQTQFKGEGLKTVNDLKKGDVVTVTYRVSGSQYQAQVVTKKAN